MKIENIRKLSLLGVLCTLCMSAVCGEISALWGKNGERWNPDSRLPDYSFAGYHSGEKEIPKVAVTANIKDFGAVGDGKHDDTQAFKDAIAKTASGAIFIPAGRYKITDIIVIRKSNLVLRGAGRDKTVLYFPIPLNTIAPNWSATTGGRKTSGYSWSGGFIAFKGSYIGKKIANIAKPARRGEKEIILFDEAKLKPGMKVVITQKDDKKQTLFRYLYSDDPGNFSNFKNRINLPFVTEIIKIDGKKITIKRPLRTDIRNEWSPELRQFSPTLSESGIEDLAFEFPNTPYKGHFTEVGFNAVDIRGCSDCWVKNIKIKNADSGIFTSSVFTVIDNVLFESERKEKKGFTGHHAFEIGGSDTLVTNFDFKTRFIHDLGVSIGSVGNVFSSGKGVDLNFDHHRRAPYENLFTDIDVGKGSNIWKSGGGLKLGKHCGARGTFWNIRSERSIKYPPESYAPASINIVGIKSDMPSVTEENGKWFEVIEPEKLTPQNIYKAQLKKRLEK